MNPGMVNREAKAVPLDNPAEHVGLDLVAPGETAE